MAVRSSTQDCAWPLADPFDCGEHLPHVGRLMVGRAERDLGEEVEVVIPEERSHGRPSFMIGSVSLAVSSSPRPEQPGDDRGRPVRPAVPAKRHSAYLRMPTARETTSTATTREMAS